jgi:hypothetical protein
MAAKRAVIAAEDARRPRDKNGMLEVPQGLLDAISKGQCIAFVGAGFSAAARLPGWAKLLEGILRSGVEAGKIPKSKKDDIQALINEATSSSFDTAAQMMEDCQAPVARVARDMLKPPDALPDTMQERLRFLKGIPFNAIVTTNFDFFLPGPPAAHDDAKPVMRKILRDPPLSMMEQIVRELQPVMEGLNKGDTSGMGDFMGKFQEYWQMFQEECPDEGEGEVADEIIKQVWVEEKGPAPIIQLHGTVAGRPGEPEMYLDDPGLAFTKLGYRRLLHGNAAYQSFLKSLMSTKTILYIGFSFSDEYLNEMRSATLMMLQSAGMLQEDMSDKQPIAYAIMSNQTDSKVNFYQKHEGVKILNYVSESGPGFECIERWLEAIHMQTNPLYRWATSLEGKRYLVYGKGQGVMALPLLVEWVKHSFGANCGELVIDAGPSKADDFTKDKVIEVMKKHGRFDVVLVAYKSNGHQTAKAMLQAMDAMDAKDKSPVLVVDGLADDKDTSISTRSLLIPRRRACLQMGAVDYLSDFSSLLPAVANIAKTPVDNKGECCMM